MSGNGISDTDTGVDNVVANVRTEFGYQISSREKVLCVSISAYLESSPKRDILRPVTSCLAYIIGVTYFQRKLNHTFILYECEI